MGEDYGVVVYVVENVLDFGVGIFFVVGIDWYMMERNVMLFDEIVESVVVGNDVGNFDVEFFGLLMC